MDGIVYECKAVTENPKRYMQKTVTLERADGMAGYMQVTPSDTDFDSMVVGKKYRITVEEIDP